MTTLNTITDKVKADYRDKYRANNGTCGDFIARRLQEIAEDGSDSLDYVKAENGIESSRWKHLNPGMQRMNFANVLRSRFLKGETIRFLGREFDARAMVESDFNGEPADDDYTMSRVAVFLDLQDNDRTVSALRSLFFPRPVA